MFWNFLIESKKKKQFYVSNLLICFDSWQTDGVTVKNNNDGLSEPDSFAWMCCACWSFIQFIQFVPQPIQNEITALNKLLNLNYFVISFWDLFYFSVFFFF